jgi:hypothetical protein
MRRPTWARAANTPEMHCIADVTDITALAYCRHSFPTHSWVEMDDAPDHERRCIECCRVLVDRRFVELGLGELVENAP